MHCLILFGVVSYIALANGQKADPACINFKNKCKAVFCPSMGISPELCDDVCNERGCEPLMKTFCENDLMCYGKCVDATGCISKQESCDFFQQKCRAGFCLISKLGPSACAAACNVPDCNAMLGGYCGNDPICYMRCVKTTGCVEANSLTVTEYLV